MITPIRLFQATGCSAALRQDPEGNTTEESQSGRSSKQQRSASLRTRPDANSTPIAPCVSGSESDIEITPIVKDHLTGTYIGEYMSEEKNDTNLSIRGEHDECKSSRDVVDTPKTANLFKIPQFLPDTKVSTSNASTTTAKEGSCTLQKSSSMNLMVPTCSSKTKVSTRFVPLKRSQSDLNLGSNRDKIPLHLISNSTSSIITVVNKPPTCDKVIQTNCEKESIGIQTSNQNDEKPMLPQRCTSLHDQKSVSSILKNSKHTYKVMVTSKIEKVDDQSTTETSQSTSVTPQPDDICNATNRANSFEYFPGHIYENVPNEGNSIVSSVDTGGSNSTMPNTSSSIEEKLWGDSDNLVRDLERSVNILKSLVDANKLDKQVKKRLIHHVVKRLVTAKYNDDKIEHELEENVPWNPDNARNKVYRTEIIQALAKNTTDSSEDWKPHKKKATKKTSVNTDKVRATNTKEIINNNSESSVSDKFDRATDRTETDGRKARMGLRTDECEQPNSSSNATPINKSESSECFLPELDYASNEKMKNIYVSSSNNTAHNLNRVVGAAVSNSRHSIDSSNDDRNTADWRLPTTMAERRYELRRHSNSESEDSKLVEYVEMAKKSQLIWITNEISLLLNLKKLLEQPKKLERPRKNPSSSPRKINHQKMTSPSKKISCSCRHSNNNVSDTSEDLGRREYNNHGLNKQWSSHCNLASKSRLKSSKTYLKKRNSYTQTQTENCGAFSKSGAEIISPFNCQEVPLNLTNSWTQTQNAEKTFKQQQRYQNFACPVHELESTSYEDFDPCLGSKSSSSQQQRPNQKLRNSCYFNKEHQASSENDYCNDSQSTSNKEKETKNHLNSLKTNNCKCEVHLHSSTHYSYKSNSFHTCDEENRKVMCQKCFNNSNCNVNSSDELKSVTLNYKKMHISNSESQSKNKSLHQNCKCENNCVNDNYKSRHENLKSPCTQTNINREHINSNNCTCHNNIYFNVEKNFKYCRVCGREYQNVRKCNCVIRYPKAIAYELTFIDSNSEKKCNSNNSDIKAKLKYSNLRSRQQIRPAMFGEDKSEHTCRKKCTLQEYLASNNPNFVDNVEIRRQYLFEMARLRQIRQENRLQLLAMASGTNTCKTPLPVCQKKYVQRLISSEEMKIRSRRRYAQLSEVQARRKLQQQQQEARCNKLMSRIFAKKLQQKVLKGQVNLSQSKSVISNLQ